MRQSKGYNRYKKPLEGHQGTFYNKALVCSQLKGLFNYETTEELYGDALIIHNAWLDTHDDVMKRPRFFNIKDCLQLDKDIYILISSATAADIDGYDFKMIFIQQNSVVILFAVPICKAFLDVYGYDMIGRFIIKGGLNEIISIMNNTQVIGFKNKEAIKLNIELLKEIESGLYHL